MLNRKNATWVGVGVLIVFVLAYWFSREITPLKIKLLPYYIHHSADNKMLETSELGSKISSFNFTDQREDTYTDKEVKGCIYVADYFFVTCPGICKEMGSQLQRVYAAFEKEKNVKILSHTSKPDEDKPDVLMAYAQKMGVKDHDKWVFLTGDKKSLYDVAHNQYHIVDELGNGDEDDFIHSERFVLIDKDSYIRGYYDGTDSASVDKLMQDIRFLLQE